MKLVLDTNAIYENWFLKGTSIALLQKYNLQIGVEIIVPEIIVLEVINLYKRELEKHISSIKKLKNLLIDEGLKIPDANKVIQEYEQLFKSRLSELKAQCPNHDDIPHSAIVRRALDCRRPFQESDKGYRDTLLWEIIKRKIASADKTTFLITNNYKDFGNKQNKQVLHQDLQQELNDAGFSPNCVQVYGTLKDFVDNEVLPRVEQKASEALTEFKKNGEYGTFSILYWFRQNREKFINSTKKWIDVVLSDKPELEDPNVVYIEDPERIEVTDAYNISEDKIYLEIIAYADTMIEVFIFKSDFWWIAERYDLHIWDNDWNDHYMWADIILIMYPKNWTDK